MTTTRLLRGALILVAFAASLAAQTYSYSNPVMPGNRPDPSVIRVGGDYWAVTTWSEWAPYYPLLHSTDLVNWRVAGSVFEEPPSWTEDRYWAPEIAEYKGRYFVYYTAGKRGGPLCIAVAVAESPAGPYQDHGPLVCQQAGSIDAVPVSDENGQRFLIWKEDGNSRKQPTPLWMQPLSEDGLRLEGEAVEMFRNDAPWENHVVEGAFVVRRDGYFYLFYSGNACCGPNCKYALGVARARSLHGPWEKHERNPLNRDNDEWRCAGHGSIVETPDGRYFLLYHAYHAKESLRLGRQIVLDEVLWGADGWPVINGGDGVSVRSDSPLARISHQASRESAWKVRQHETRDTWRAQAYLTVR